MDSHLPDPLPANPLALLDDWLAEARTAAAQPNPNSMVLATVDGHGQPSARVVLCKEMCIRDSHGIIHPLLPTLANRRNDSCSG